MTVLIITLKVVSCFKIGRSYGNSNIQLKYSIVIVLIDVPTRSHIPKVSNI